MCKLGETRALITPMASSWSKFAESMTPAPSPSGRTEHRSWAWWVALGIVAVFLVLATIARLPGVGVGNDDAMYVFLGKALLQGTYRDIFVPDAPYHVQYPPGWPFFLAIGLGVFGDRPELLLKLPLVFSAGGLLFLFAAARRALPPVAALAVLTLAAANPLLITYGGRLKSEAPFFFFAMLALWAFAAPDASRRRLLVGCAAAIASAFTRTVGVAVIAAVLLHFVIGRRWRWAIGFGLAAALTFGPWLAWSLFGPRQVVGRSYAGDLLQVEAARAAGTGQNLVAVRIGAALLRARLYFFGHVPAAMGFSQRAGTLLDNLGWVALLATAGVAGVVGLWRRARIVVLLTGCMLGVLIVWTWADRRFLHPIIPLVGLTLVSGATVIGRRFGRFGEVVGPLAIIAILGTRTLHQSAGLVRWGRGCDRTRPVSTCYNPVEREFLEAAVAARALPDTAVILVQREAAFSYHSGRPGVYATEGIGQLAVPFLSFLQAKGVTHLVVSRITREELVKLPPRLDSICDRLDVIGDFGEGTYLFQLRADGPPGASGPACEVTRRLVEESARIRERAGRGDFFELPDRDDR